MALLRSALQQIMNQTDEFAEDNGPKSRHDPDSPTQVVRDRPNQAMSFVELNDAGL
jgi:hypothetical protein